MEYQIWLNGEYVERDKATISMNDRGFKLGDVVFDTSRTFNGAVFRLRDHLVRLYRSLKYVRLDPGMSIAEMERLTLEVVARNEEVRSSLNDDYMITQIVTGGSGQRGEPPNVSIWLSPLARPDGRRRTRLAHTPSSQRLAHTRLRASTRRSSTTAG